MQKQSTLLSRRENLSTQHRNMLDDMVQKFTKKQGLFQGFRKTYQALEGFADDDTKRGFQNVSSTVDEQLDYFREHSKEYLALTLSIEKTNSTGIKSELILDGEIIGEYSVLELLRMKSLIDGKLKLMLQELPVRDEKSIWKLSQQEEFLGRNVFENIKIEGHSRTTLKDTKIVEDPHFTPGCGRNPVTKEINILANIGVYTSQDFSGAISMRERASYITKLAKFNDAIIEALEKANNVPSHESDLGDRFLEYIFNK